MRSCPWVALVLGLCFVHLCASVSVKQCYQPYKVFQGSDTWNLDRFAFKPEYPGNYTFKVTVRDYCQASSQEVQVEAKCVGPPPKVELRPGQAYWRAEANRPYKGARVTLKGAHTHDKDVEYKWALYSPINSKTTLLVSADERAVTFIPDMADLSYTVVVAVTEKLPKSIGRSDNGYIGCSTTYQQVTVKPRCNCAPAVNAGSPGSLIYKLNNLNSLGQLVLDGTKTVDDDVKDVITYDWDIMAWDSDAPNSDNLMLSKREETAKDPSGKTYRLRRYIWSQPERVYPAKNMPGQVVAVDFCTKKSAAAMRCTTLTNTTSSGIVTDPKFVRDFTGLSTGGAPTVGCTHDWTTSDIPVVRSANAERTNTTYYYTQRVTQTFLRTCTAELRNYDKATATLAVVGEPSGYAACSGIMDVSLTANDNCNKPKDIVKVSVGCNAAPIATMKCTQFSYFTGTKYEPVYIDARGTKDPDGDAIIGTPENPKSKLGNKYGSYRVTPYNLKENLVTPWDLQPYSRDESTEVTKLATFEPWIRRFTPGTSGDYQIRIEVTDGCSVAFDEIFIYARCPFLVAETLVPSVAYFDAFNVPEFSLNGTLSTIKTQMKAYTKIFWSLLSTPNGSKVTSQSIANATGHLLATFKPDRGGVYKAQLLLDDSCNASKAVQQITYSCGLNSTHDAMYTAPQVKTATINADKEAATTSLSLTYPSSQTGFKKVEVNVREVEYTGRGKDIAFTFVVRYPSNKTTIFGPYVREAKDVKQKKLTAAPVSMSFVPDKTEVGVVKVDIQMDDGCQVATHTGLQFTTVCSAITARPQYWTNDQGGQLTIVQWLTDKFDKARVKGSAVEPTPGQAGSLTYTWSIVNGTVTEMSNTANPTEFSFRPTSAGDIRIQLAVQRKDGGCKASTNTIIIKAQCRTRNFVPNGVIASSKQYTSAQAIFPKVKAAYWMTAAQANAQEVFGPQQLDGTKIVDTDLLKASSNPPLDLNRVTYRWASISPAGVKINNFDQLTASYTPANFKSSGAASQMYNFSLTVNDGCQNYVYYYIQTASCQAIRATIRSTPSSALTFSNQMFPIINFTAEGSSFGGEVKYYDFNRLSYQWKVMKSPAGSKYNKSGKFLNQKLKPATTKEERVESLEPKDAYSVDGSHKNTTVITKTTVSETVTDVDMSSVLKNHGAFQASTCFRPDLPGEYIVTLVITDMCGGSSTAQQVVVQASCPQLSILFDQRLPNNSPGDSYTASGKGDVRLMLNAAPTEISAANTNWNNPMMFEWTLKIKPRNSTLSTGVESYKSINNYQASIASFRPDTNGIYVFDVTVKDGCQTVTKSMTWRINCAIPARLTVRVDKQLLTYNVNQFATSNLIGSIAGDACNVRGWEWTLARFNCTGFVPKPPPPAPPPADLVCKPRFQYTWSLVDKPCKSARTTSDILDRHEKICRFTPDVPGAYRFVLKVNDDCSEAEDAIVLQAMCRNKIEVQLRGNATSALSCKKGEYDPIKLTAKYNIIETAGISAQEGCTAPTTPPAPVTVPVIEERCCPQCPTCPRCPMCPTLDCPSCDCPPYRVCQIVGGFDNCTGRGFRRSDGDQDEAAAVAETSPSFPPPPSFDAPSGAARLTASIASSGGTISRRQVSSRLMSLEDEQKTFDEYKVVNVSLDEGRQLDGHMTINTGYSTVSATQQDYDEFKSEARDFVAKSSQVPTSAVEIKSVEAKGEQTVVAFHIVSTEAKAEAAHAHGQQALTVPFSADDAEYEESKADSRERVLWLAAALPISVLLVLSVAVNVVVIQYYTQLVKSVRFAPARMQQRSAA